MKAPPKILFALLDWGMGHASRTAPLIEFALNEKWEVHIASKGTALAFLKSQFEGSGAYFHLKPGPEIAYARRGNLFKIALQIPGFLTSIGAEQQWTASLVAKLNITHIVSDNCYGVHHSSIPSVLISHQLQLPVPSLLSGLARHFVIRQARRFQSIWVPDVDGFRFSGKLAAKNPLPHMQAVGILSRLSNEVNAEKFDLVGMVSGPEPHRSLMENALMEWMQSQPKPALLIAGRPGDIKEEKGHVTIWPNPNATELAAALKGAKIIVCRSGYSSLMDLVALGKSAILVPTPGQPEQLYLAKHWKKTFGMATCSQTDLEHRRIPEKTGSMDMYQPNIRACELLRTWVQ